MTTPKTPKDDPLEKADDTQHDIVKPTIIVPAGKHPSEWTDAERDAYYASLPPDTHFMTDEEMAEEEAQYPVDLDAMTPEEFQAYYDSL